MAPPQVPQRWGEIETITITYGHGIAVAPLQFAAAAARLVNGGRTVTPTFVSGRPTQASRDIPRDQRGDERRDARADAAQRRRAGRHRQARRRAAAIRSAARPARPRCRAPAATSEKAVISSFLAAFPMDAPRYVVFVLLFEPKGTEETGGEITAGRNAAPTAGPHHRAASAPLLGVLPHAGRGDARAQRATAFDASGARKI